MNPKYWIIALVLAAPCIFAAPPNITLVSPANNNLSHSSSMIFFCNVTDDLNVFRVDFYNSINGYQENQTRRMMELDNDEKTKMLCRFNDTYTCDGGQTGTNSSTVFKTGRFLSGVEINDSDTLRYATSGNIDYNNGSIEFWVLAGNAPMYMLFDMQGNDRDKMQIFVDSGVLYFIHDDDDQSGSSVSRPVSWAAGEWHLVSALWDINGDLGNGRFNLYVDGNNTGNSYDDQFGSPGLFSQFMYIGSDQSGTSQASSMIDEFRISDRPRTSDEINISYAKGVANHTREFVNFSLTGIPDGTYLWNCRAQDNDSATSFATQNFTFSVDITMPPLVNSINLAPNNTDGIDPGTTVVITANVTDASGVGNVTFQWRETGDWNNDTMDYNASTGMYVNASIAVDVTGGTYFYRIWSNDTLGNGNFTPTFNVSANYDYTWTTSPTTFNSSGRVSTVKNTANITINNTGDDTLTFSINDDWPFPVFYNGSETPSYIIAAKNVSTIQVNTTFENQDSERNITINVTASHTSETPAPTSRTLTGSIISFTGGSYLIVTITSITSNIPQSTSGDITATIKNIGNETAPNVAFNWSLPSNWAVTLGSPGIFLGNMSPGQTNSSSIEVSVSYLATSGISTVCANATGTNVSNATCQNVQVSCSNSDGVCGAGCAFTNDNNCPVSSGSSGGGGSSSISVSGGAAIVPRIKIESIGRFEAFRDWTALIDVSVLNIERGTFIEDIILSVEGHPQNYVKVFGDVTNISYNQTANFRVEIYIPDYTPLGLYPILLKAQGRGKVGNLTKNTTAVEAESPMSLFIHSASESESARLLDLAKNKVADMQQSEFNSDALVSAVLDAEKAMEIMDYDAANKLLQQVIDTTAKAFDVNTRLGRMAADINEAEYYGIEANETRKLYSLAVQAFGRGDYERADERLQNALLAQNLEIGNKVLLKKISENSEEIFISFAVISVFGIIIAQRYGSIKAAKSKIKRLEKEGVVLHNLILGVQQDFYSRNSISRLQFRQRSAEYQKRISEIKKELIKLNSKKTNIFSKKTNPTKQMLLDEIKNVQRMHFEDGTMTKIEYNEAMKSLRKGLVDAEKDGQKRGRKFFSIVLLALLVMHVVHADISAVSTAIERAESDIRAMQAKGFEIVRANDTLNEAISLFSKQDYEGAEVVALYVHAIKNSAERSDRLIEETEARIYDFKSRGLDISDVQSAFNSSVEAFNEERFEESEQVLAETNAKLDNIEAEMLVQETRKEPGESVQETIQKNSTLIILLALSIPIFWTIYKTYIQKYRMMQKAKRLEQEHIRLQDAIRDAQQKRFVQGSMSGIEYETSMRNYQKRLDEIDRNLRVLRK